MTKIKQLHSLNKEALLKFASDNLTFVGEGHGRVVYEFDQKSVLKIAKNEFGEDQNKKEALSCFEDMPVPRLIANSKDGNWIVVEKVNTTEQAAIDEYLEDAGLDDIEGLKSVIKAGMYDAWVSKDVRQHKRLQAFHDMLIEKNSWYRRFFKMLDSCDVDLDEVRYDNVGMLDGELVMLDVGM